VLNDDDISILFVIDQVKIYIFLGDRTIFF